MIYGLRVLALGHVLGDADAEADTVYPRLENYCRSYLHNRAPTVFDEVFGQRNYASSIAKDFYGRPSIHWESDRLALRYEGDRVSIVGVQT